MTNEKIDKLQNLGAQVGDVVRCVTKEQGNDWALHEGLEQPINDIGGKLFWHGIGQGLWPELLGGFQIVRRAELPYGHARLPSGKVVDLTALTAPVGLLDADTQAALKAHGGPYEFFAGSGKWKNWPQPGWDFTGVYRVAPKPVVETVTEAMWLDHSDGWVGVATPGRTPVIRTFTRINGTIDLASYRLTARKEGDK